MRSRLAGYGLQHAAANLLCTFLLSLWTMRWVLSPGSAGLMAASSIELAISAFGEVDVAQLTMEPSKQSRTGER